MRTKKRRLETFSFYDRTGIEKHLTEMAARGWMLEKIGMLWHYRRIEPQQLHFAVTYFPRASAFDPGPSADEQTFVEFCERAGWQKAASSAQLQVFWNVGPDPVPLETDAVLQVETISRAAKKSFLLGQILLLFVSAL